MHSIHIALVFSAIDNRIEIYSWHEWLVRRKGGHVCPRLLKVLALLITPLDIVTIFPFLTVVDREGLDILLLSTSSLVSPPSSVKALLKDTVTSNVLELSTGAATCVARTAFLTRGLCAAG